MKRAIEMFFPGEGLPVYPESIYADDHPLVLSYPSKFVDVEVIEAPNKRRSAPVEQATAAPGEQRTTRK